MRVVQKNRSRRDFIKLLGQSAGVLGVGGMVFFNRLSWSQPEIQTGLDLVKGDEWEIFKPGVYDADDQKIIGAFKAEIDKLNSRGKLSFQDLVSSNDWTHGNNVRGEVTNELRMAQVNNFGGRNPLFLDEEYAKKTQYGKPIAPPLIIVDEYMPAMPAGVGDYMVVSRWNGTTSFYKPVFEGDNLYSVVDQRHFRDITPAEGCKYRTFILSGTGRVFNQKGELVGEGANVLTESFRRNTDKSKRFKTRAWESPDWWHQRPKYQYTDADWEKITGMWKKEKRRGSTPLYWDDVKIGDQPDPYTNSPILADITVNMMFTMPQWATDLKYDILDPKKFKTLVKNEQGIYVPPDRLIKGEDTDPLHKAEVEQANRDGRSVVQNSFCARWAANMIYNWMGDHGWLARMGWDIMADPPGYPKSIIPPIPKQDMPGLFDKHPYLDQVPFMKGKCAEAHPLEGDIITNRGYVTDKYKKGNEYFVDLIWWCETYDKYIVQEGHATVRLPKRA